MLLKKTLLVVSLTVVLAACSTATNEKWQNFDNKSLNENISSTDAGIVVYRDNSGESTPAVNIAVNGEYQTSLQRNGFSEVVVCAQPQRIGAFTKMQDPAYIFKHTGGKYYTLEGGKLIYFRVSVDEMGNVAMTEVDQNTAKEEMANARFQANTLSRVEYANTCGPKSYVLNASALFPFDQYSANSILPNGRDEIRAIAKDIQEYPANIRSVEVSGYTDPQGSAEYNQTLSQQRAKTVKELLVHGGVKSNLVHAAGYGAQNLKVTNCEAQHAGNTSELQVCNQPNRRVEIKLHTVNN